jgi:hypothetical protein
MKHIPLLSIMLLTLFACSQNEAIKRTPVGRPGDLLIVMDDSIKSSQGGQFLQSLMIQPVLSLPQHEELFTIHIIPWRAFNEQKKALRNIVMVQQNNAGNKDTIIYYIDHWASNQSVAVIYSQSGTQLKQVLEKHEISFINFFLKTERERMIANNKRTPNIELNTLIKDQWNISLSVSNAYRKNKCNNSFTWMSNEGPVYSIGLMIYAFEYTGKNCLAREYLIHKRDSVLQQNIAGPSAGSYMTTELDFPVISSNLIIDNQPVVELKGLWKVDGDMMGGPFISHAHIDHSKNRIIVTEGYVYSPEKPNKRNLLRQAEAILYTYKTLSEPARAIPVETQK